MNTLSDMTRGSHPFEFPKNDSNSQLSQLPSELYTEISKYVNIPLLSQDQTLNLFVVKVSYLDGFAKGLCW